MILPGVPITTTAYLHILPCGTSVWKELNYEMDTFIIAKYTDLHFLIWSYVIYT